jgi:hypothetical protein
MFIRPGRDPADLLFSPGRPWIDNQNPPIHNQKKLPYARVRAAPLLTLSIVLKVVLRLQEKG